jgi:hypothetical protein
VASLPPDTQHATGAPDRRRLRTRRRRILVSLPVAASSWLFATGLPFAAPAPKAGTMHSEIIELTAPSSRSARTAPPVVNPGWTTTIDVADGTQALGASWLGSPQGAVTVRARTGSVWGPWVDMAADPEYGPDDAERDSGEMAWFGADGVDEVELRVTTGTLRDLEVQTMRYEEPEPGGAFVTAIAGAAASQPSILPRSMWTTKGWATANEGCASGPILASGGLKFAVVHHTVNANTYAADDVPAMLAAIYAYHTGTNRWCDIAYNFVVDRFGRIWEGRSGGIDKAVVGGHAAGFNTGSMGVAMLGQFEPGASPAAVQPTSAALDAAARLLGWKLGLFGVSASATTTVTSGGSNKYPAGTPVTIPTIIGHRDVGLTACPGANLYGKLPSMRTAAKAYQGSTTTTSPPTTTTTPPPPPQFAPFTSAAALVTQQYRDVLYRDPSSSELDYWGARVGTSWSPGQFIAHLTTRSEADDRVHAVTRLYRAFFLRDPDYSGLRYWLNRRGEGRTIASIANSFAESSEFVRRYGSLSNAGFVDLVYRNVLGRAADSSGLTYWTTRLASGTPRGQVMANFSQSGEYVRKTEDRSWVISLYVGLVRAAPPANELTFFTAGLAAGNTSLTSVATYLYDGTSYRTRFR